MNDRGRPRPKRRPKELPHCAGGSRKRERPHRCSFGKQDLDRQIEALAEAGVARKRIYVDKKSGATVDRPGLRAVFDFARDGDVIVVHTFDRLGRTVRDTLNLIHELSERGVGVRNLADPIRARARGDRRSPEPPYFRIPVGCGWGGQARSGRAPSEGSRHGQKVIAPPVRAGACGAPPPGP
jgi:Resolvase, N terminal domain